MCVKQIILNNKRNLEFCIINNKFFLKKKDSQNFFHIPDNIFCEIDDNILLIKTHEDNGAFLDKFSEFLNIFLKSNNKVFTKKLLLKGLGLKVNQLTVENLQLKLGFSHLIDVKIPAGLSISFIKNIITVQGPDFSDVGNFANFLKKKKLPDSYKGKGLWYKNEKLVLKLVKKT
jgi:large subunit ribosomal protein L6